MGERSKKLRASVWKLGESELLSGSFEDVGKGRFG